MDGGIDDLYLNFNVLNNEVFEIGSDDKLLEVAERAIVRNKGFVAEGKQLCMGTIWVPDDFWKMEIAERGAYLEESYEQGYFRYTELKIEFGKFFVQAKRIVKN